MPSLFDTIPFDTSTTKRRSLFDDIPFDEQDQQPPPTMPFGMPETERPAASSTAVGSQPLMPTPQQGAAELESRRPSMGVGNMLSPWERKAQEGDQITTPTAEQYQTDYPASYEKSRVSGIREQAQTAVSAVAGEFTEQATGGLIPTTPQEEAWLQKNKGVGKVAGVAGVAAMMTTPDPIFGALGKLLPKGKELLAALRGETVSEIKTAIANAVKLPLGQARNREIRFAAMKLTDEGIPAAKADIEAVVEEVKANPVTPELPSATGEIKAMPPPVETAKSQLPVEPPTTPVVESGLSPELQAIKDEVAQGIPDHPIEKVRKQRKPKPTTESLVQPTEMTTEQASGFRKLQQDFQERQQKAWESLTPEGGEFVRPNGDKLIVSKNIDPHNSAKYPWRITRVVDEVPYGHEIYKNLDEVTTHLTQQRAVLPTVPKELGVGDEVIWSSPHSGQDTPMNFRGFDGDNAVLVNPKTGMQVSVPKNQISQPAPTTESLSQPATDLSYHGTSSIHAANIKSKGFLLPKEHGFATATMQPDYISLTTSKKVADEFSVSVSNFTKGSKPETLEVSLKDLKIADDPKGEWGGRDNLDDFISDLKAKGYDGLKLEDTGESEIIVWNNKKLRVGSQPSLPSPKPAVEGKQAVAAITTPPTKPVAESQPSPTTESLSQIITDPTQVQEIRNSIAEGESILKSGKTSNGRKMSETELSSVQRAVNNSKQRIGKSVSESQPVLNETQTTKGLTGETQPAPIAPKPAVEGKQAVAAITTPIAKPVESSKVYDVKLSDVKTDPERFQNRLTPFSEETAATVAESYNVNKFDPIVLWKDPANGTDYVLSGHSRLEGMKRRGSETISSRYFEGAEQEAIIFAKVEGNRLATPEGLRETISAYKRAKEAKYTKKKLQESFDGDTGLLDDIQHLNPKGQFLEQLTAEGSAGSFPYLKRTSRWVGELKGRYPDKLTNSHEAQLFDYLYRSEKRGYEMPKDDFLNLVEKQLDTFDYDPSKPLVLKRGEVMTGTRARADTGAAERAIDELKTRQKQSKTVEEYKALQTEIDKHRANIAEAVKKQGDIFAEPSHPIMPNVEQAAIDAGKGKKITLGKVLPGETPPKSGGQTFSAVGGSSLGFQKDDEGNWEYDPVVGMAGLIGGIAVMKGGEKIIGKLKTRKPDINFEHFNISAADRPAFEKAVNDAVERTTTEWRKIYGDDMVLTNERLKALADDAKALNHIIPIGQQEKFISSVVAAGQKTLALGKEIGMGEAGKVATLSKEFVESLTSYSSGYTFFARGLQSGKVLKDPILNLPQNKIIRRLIELGNDSEKITEAFKGVDLNNKRAVIKVWNEFVKPSLWNRIRDYRYFNMLSGPLTQMRNNFGNASQIALRAATKTLTFDHPITYIKTVTSKDVQMKALKNFWNAGMGRSWGDIRPDFENIGGTFAFPFSPTNMLEASDQYFRTIAIEGEKAGLLRKGFTEAAAQSEAERRGAYSVFRSELDPKNVHGQGWLLSWLDKATGVVLKARELEPVAWYVPFVQTPMQIFKQGIEYSPLGFATIPKAAFKGERAAKAAMGSMVFATAGALAMSDRLTWASPKSAEQRKKAQETGWQPYSVRLGEGTYVSYSGLGPLSYPIAMAAAAKYYYEDAPKAYTQDFWTNFGEAMRGTAQFLSDQSYMQGMGELVDAVSGDVDIKRALTNPARQLIPATALQSAVSKFFDPVIRKAEGGASAKSMGQTMIRDMIYFSKFVPAVKDEEGNPIERRNTGINTISPLRISTTDAKSISEYDKVGEKQQYNAVKTKARDLFKENPDSPEGKKLLRDWNQAQPIDSLRTMISVKEVKDADMLSRRGELIDEGVKAMRLKQDTGDSRAWDAFALKKNEWNRKYPDYPEIKEDGYFKKLIKARDKSEEEKLQERKKNLSITP